MRALKYGLLAADRTKVEIEIVFNFRSHDFCIYCF